MGCRWLKAQSISQGQAQRSKQTDRHLPGFAAADLHSLMHPFCSDRTTLNSTAIHRVHGLHRGLRGCQISQFQAQPRAHCTSHSSHGCLLLSQWCANCTAKGAEPRLHHHLQVRAHLQQGDGQAYACWPLSQMCRSGVGQATVRHPRVGRSLTRVGRSLRCALAAPLIGLVGLHLQPCAQCSGGGSKPLLHPSAHAAAGGAVARAAGGTEAPPRFAALMSLYRLANRLRSCSSPT